jgi:hypothetical protein
VRHVSSRPSAPESHFDGRPFSPWIFFPFVMMTFLGLAQMRPASLPGQFISTPTTSSSSRTLGWRLQIQTNSLSEGIGTNWATVPNSASVNSTNIVIHPANGSVFLRLVYP